MHDYLPFVASPPHPPAPHPSPFPAPAPYTRAWIGDSIRVPLGSDQGVEVGCSITLVIPSSQQQGQVVRAGVASPACPEGPGIKYRAPQ